MIMDYREFIKHVKAPIAYGCYDKYFLLMGESPAEMFFMCWRCLTNNDYELLRKYALEIYNGHFTVKVDSSAEIDPEEIYCEECYKDLSAYAEESE